ncbi:Disulfide isomerase [Croceitalea dokdonensis DOKDO 023]|uniref:Disulfide isomerase n=1 Tax=Croceitalea dokdonensis DOKDO 023 TaxID=1300341 RepID=A0A0P7B1Y9_9FLAO|nr:thioredoxin family protein [Croceitalea dokdonensis]KPM33246.1 Disulfide isomerase [Croceitalea dokdonensis DOKDO 023]
MKILLVLLTFVWIIPLQNSTQQPAETVDWETDYESVLKSAKKEKKNVLVYFTGSDWCPPCKMLKKDLFDSAEFEEISKEYVLLYVDIPRNKDLLSSRQLEHNKKLVSKYNKKGVFPLLVALSKNGVVLDDYSGYSMNGEIGYHLEFLQKNK